ncbi:MAG: hypothetical protein ACR2O0_04890, partial [Rhizobiaceae bacterium]
HDPVTKLGNGKRWTTKGWIICNCKWQNRRRDVWGFQNGPGRPGWSELFFLDEVTALAAGHRPCFYCRRADANRFRSAFVAGNPECDGSAPSMDRLLHDQRRLSGKHDLPALTSEDIAILPDGTMLELNGEFFALKKGALHRWDFAGYGKKSNLKQVAGTGKLVLVTPKSTVGALANGFLPSWHYSAGS